MPVGVMAFRSSRRRRRGCASGVPRPDASRTTCSLRLVMRNVGGQVVGESSKSVFGQPGRVTGIVVGEWEERSPWAPLSERRGAAAGSNAVTVHGCTGTIDVADIVADNGHDLVAVIGKSLAVLGTNAFIGSHPGAELMIAIAPPWAELISSSFAALDDVCAEMWRSAALPVSWWPEPHQQALHG